MHEEYGEEDYEEDDYNYDDKYKHYFKFDPSAWDAWGKYLYDSLNEIVDNHFGIWYVGGGLPSQNMSFHKKNMQYLGKNYQGTDVWKKKYFIEDKLNNEYINHLKQYPVHFLQQPYYYNGIFDILN